MAGPTPDAAPVLRYAAWAETRKPDGFCTCWVCYGRYADEALKGATFLVPAEPDIDIAPRGNDAIGV